MNLAQRLRVGQSIGSFVMHKLHGKFLYSHKELIDAVLDRYANRFGVVKNEQANILQRRLAIKYSNNPDATMMSFNWKVKDDIAYPTKLASIMYEANMFPSGTYCVIKKEIPLHHRCDCCGCLRYYEQVDENSISKTIHNDKRINGWDVCNNKRCRTIAVFFKRGRSDFPLINVLNEVTKHGGNNENKRRLEKHFIRHA